MSRGVRGWGLCSFVVAGLALGAAPPGCGSSGPKGGAAGSDGGAGSLGAAGATGAAGTSGGAGAMGGAGAPGGAGSSGGSGNTNVGDASADAPATPPDDGGVASADAACGTTRLDRVAPDLLLLLDKSGSMNQQLDGSNCPGGGAMCVSKWTEVTKAINQVVQETERSINWGLKSFPGNNTCGVTAGVAVPVGPMNATPIAAAIAATPPLGQTPTRLAVASAAQYLATLTDPNPKFLLLATDGLPNCGVGNPNATDDDSAAAIAAVKMLADSGIPVYVIGIGTVTTGVSTLGDIARAGGRPRAVEPAYYPVEGSADLVDALRAIGAQTMPCTYALPEAPAVPSAVVIRASNAVVPRDANHVEGWDYEATGKTIKLYGSWCAKDQAGTLANVEESSPCPAGGPPG